MSTHTTEHGRTTAPRPPLAHSTLRLVCRATLPAILAIGGTIIGGCGATVTPPEDPVDPVSVFIADHGIHASLLLGRQDGTVAQYAFSQWAWAALDQDQWYRSLPALLIPARGTIGTRDFPGPAEYEPMALQAKLMGSDPSIDKIYEVVVSREAKDVLLSKLDARWDAHADQRVFNEKRAMLFVMDDESYSLFHNCNAEVTGWLKELGCKVSGVAVTADFSVRESPRAVADRKRRNEAQLGLESESAARANE